MDSMQFENLMAAMEHYAAKVQQERTIVEANKMRWRQMEKATADLEERRRKGEMGRAWQILQQRIDLGMTTADDVLEGKDTSPEAMEVRRNMQRNLDTFREKLEDEDNPEESVLRARGELARGLARLQEMERRMHSSNHGAQQ